MKSIVLLVAKPATGKGAFVNILLQMFGRSETVYSHDKDKSIGATLLPEEAYERAYQSIVEHIRLYAKAINEPGFDLNKRDTFISQGNWAARPKYLSKIARLIAANNLEKYVKLQIVVLEEPDLKIRWERLKKRQSDRDDYLLENEGEFVKISAKQTEEIYTFVNHAHEKKVGVLYETLPDIDPQDLLGRLWNKEPLNIDPIIMFANELKLNNPYLDRNAITEEVYKELSHIVKHNMKYLSESEQKYIIQVIVLFFCMHHPMDIDKKLLYMIERKKCLSPNASFIRSDNTFTAKVCEAETENPEKPVLEGRVTSPPLRA